MIEFSLNSIPIFIEVVKQRSFTKAAIALGVPLSKVSKNIASLERELKVKLLQRSTRRISLTNEGRAFFELTISGIQQIKDAHDLIHDMQEEHSGNIKILLPYSFGVTQISPLIAKFLTEYPDISIEITFSDERLDFMKEGFDLSLVTGKLEDSSMISRRICPLRSIICCSKEYKAAHSVVSRPEHLSNHNCLVYSNSLSKEKWKFINKKTTTDITVKGNILTNSGESLLAFLLQGVGVTRLPTFLASDYLKSGKLIHLLKNYKMPSKDLFLLYPDRQYMPQKIRTFIDFIVLEIGDEIPPWDNSIF